MSIKIFIVSVFLLSLCFSTKANNFIRRDSSNVSEKGIDILFYNLENLFDPVDDEGSADDEFTPNGKRKWTPKKYDSKLTKISQAVLRTNDWRLPGIIAVSEIENKKVLNDLRSRSLFQKAPYKMIHKESRDHRGIDTGILYDSTIFELSDVEFYEVELETGLFSRDILYAKFRHRDDSLHLIVCHWPSRYSGRLSSKEHRAKASQIVTKLINRLYSSYGNPKIIVMGDFNDEPHDESLQYLIHQTSGETSKMINLMKDKKKGSLKYQNRWYVFDQFIVSSALLKNNNGLSVIGEAEICLLPFLLVRDKKFLGNKPYRTYNGFRYSGGYSDHLPIRLKLGFFK